MPYMCTCLALAMAVPSHNMILIISAELTTPLSVDFFFPVRGRIYICGWGEEYRVSLALAKPASDPHVVKVQSQGRIMSQRK